MLPQVEGKKEQEFEKVVVKVIKEIFVEMLKESELFNVQVCIYVREHFNMPLYMGNIM